MSVKKTITMQWGRRFYQEIKTKLLAVSVTQQRMWRFVAIAMLGAGLTIVAPALQLSGNFGRWVEPLAFSLSPQPVLAQQGKSIQTGAQVYQRLPDLPQENNYVNVETGKVDPNNTLVSRLIRYHLYVKGRPAKYRLDWKLTLADYIGANELMEPSVYPGRDVLKENPMERDRAAISSLNRAQRDELVQALLSIFNPNSESTSEPQPAPSPTTSEPPKPPSRRTLPQPGDANLLKHHK